MKAQFIPVSLLFSLGLSSFALANDAGHPYQGANSMKRLINTLLETGRCGSIDYLAQGGVVGEAEIMAGAQQTAPMNQPFRQGFCDKNFRSIQMAIGTDQMLVVNNNGRDEDRDRCSTSMVTSVPGYQSSAPEWAQALQLIYGGDQGRGSQSACIHPKRVELINNWYKLWDDACVSGECTRLRFAFRPGDRSGSTRFFKKLVHIDKFCNGKQHEDLDPVRTPCAYDPWDTSLIGKTQYCPNGTIGVVQAIDVPDTFSDEKGMKPCTNGAFTFLSVPTFGDSYCPDGALVFAGFLCQYPTDCDDSIECINYLYNGSPFGPFMDGRIYNLPENRTNSPNTFALSKIDSGYHDQENDEILTETSYSPTPVFLGTHCGLTTATERIACLTSEMKCSIGFGSSAMLKARRHSGGGSKLTCDNTEQVTHNPIRLNGKAPTDQGYPVPRHNLFMNMRGIPVFNNRVDWENIKNADERALCECIFEESELLNSALRESGFEPIPGGPKVVLCGESM